MPPSGISQHSHMLFSIFVSRRFFVPPDPLTSEKGRMTNHNALTVVLLLLSSMLILPQQQQHCRWWWWESLQHHSTGCCALETGTDEDEQQLPWSPTWYL